MAIYGIPLIKKTKEFYVASPVSETHCHVYKTVMPDVRSIVPVFPISLPILAEMEIKRLRGGYLFLDVKDWGESLLVRQEDFDKYFKLAEEKNG